MSDPYYLPPRSVVSFSGGRTSGLMLRRILDAHGGSLPADRVVLFCNTGKERPETLDFVEECSQQWACPITWLEYRYTAGLPIRHTKAGKPACLDSRAHGFVVVNYATASRDGRPFADAIRARCDFRAAKGEPGLLPHVMGRYCTAELKTRTKGRYVRSVLGWTDGYSNAIGFRADEPKRVAKVMSCDFTAEAACNGERPLVPLHSAGVTEADVMGFWKRQPFDLRLQQHEGNCDLCFLKAPWKLKEIMRRQPHLSQWWAAQEEATGDVFRQDRPNYMRLPVIARAEGPGMFCASADELEADCACTD